MMSVASARRRNQKPTTSNGDVGSDVGHLVDIYYLKYRSFIQLVLKSNYTAIKGITKIMATFA